VKPEVMALVFFGLLATSPAFAGGAVKHSGTLVAVDAAKHVLTLEEMGPWTGRGTVPMTRSIRIEPSTNVELITRRSESAPGARDYQAAAMPLSELRAGDFVTVTAAQSGNDLTAESVEVVRPDGAE
jgi:hypothetical protein